MRLLLLLISLSGCGAGLAFGSTTNISCSIVVQQASPPWFDSLPIGTTNGSQPQIDSSLSYSQSVTVSNSGTAIALRLAVQEVAFDGTAAKMALYDSSSDLVTSGTATLNVSDSGTIKTFTVTHVAVTATNYFIAWTTLGGATPTWAVDTNSTGTIYFSPAFAGFPASTLTGGAAYGFKAYVGVQVR